MPYFVTKDDIKTKNNLQEEGKSFLPHDGVQRNLHGCLYHLLSEFCRKNLSVAYLV